MSIPIIPTLTMSTIKKVSYAYKNNVACYNTIVFITIQSPTTYNICQRIHVNACNTFNFLSRSLVCPSFYFLLCFQLSFGCDYDLLLTSLTMSSSIVVLSMHNQSEHLQRLYNPSNSQNIYILQYLYPLISISSDIYVFHLVGSNKVAFHHILSKHC